MVYLHCFFHMTRAKELQKVSLELIREVRYVFSWVLIRCVSKGKSFLFRLKKLASPTNRAFLTCDSACV